MSFESTKNSIENLSKQDRITLDNFFHMMVCVAQDVMVYNNTSDLNSTPVGDSALLLKKMCNLLQMSLSVYENNKNCFVEIPLSIQERCSSLMSSINNITKEISEINEENKNFEEKKKIYQKKRDELDEKRGHLLSLEEECKELEGQIGILSNSELDKKAEEKEKLEADLAARKNKFDVIENEKNNLLKEFIKSENDITKIQKEKEELESKEKMLLKQKSELEENIAVLQKNVREYEEWVEKYPDMSAELQEKNAEILLAINAVESAMSEDFIKDNFFEIPNTGDNLSFVANSQFENAEQLKQWFNDMDNSISSLISVYERVLKILVEYADKLKEK